MTQKELAAAVFDAGYRHNLTQGAISQIEKDLRPVPALMLAPLLRALPELSEGNPAPALAS